MKVDDVVDVAFARIPAVAVSLQAPLATTNQVSSSLLPPFQYCIF
jgi:hypothetical protein